MRSITPWLLALCACTAEPAPKGEPRPTTPTADTGPQDTGAALATGQTGHTGHTGTTADTGQLLTLQATCTPDPTNSLLASCVIQTDPPGPVEIAYGPADGSRPERVHQSLDNLAEHVVELYLMPANTDIRWEARRLDTPTPAQGSFTTGPLPQGAKLKITGGGTSTASLMGIQGPCSYGAMGLILDPNTSQVLWYHDFRDNLNNTYLEGISFTEDHTIVAITDGPDALIEVDLMGREVLKLQKGTDYKKPTHHDAFKHDGYLYTPFQESVSTGHAFTMVDGFYVFDSAGALVETWKLTDHLAPAPPIGYEYSHANAIWVADTGEIYFSLRALSGVMKLKGTPGSPDFGEVIWMLGGEPGDPQFPSDFTLSAAAGPASFIGQHNPHLLPSGQLALFDNRQVEDSRLLHIDLDESLFTAEIVEAFDLPLQCPFQGGAWHTEAGNGVATCAPSDKAWEFQQGQADPVWWMRTECSVGWSNYIPRFVPLEW